MKHFIFIFLFIAFSIRFYGQNIQPTRVMSQAYTTYAEQGIAGLFGNQAGLHRLSGLAVEASAMQRYFSEGVLELHLGAATPLGEHSGAGIYVKRFGDDIFSEQSFGLAMGRKLFENFSMGVGLEVYQLNIENYGNELQFNTQLGFQADISKSVRLGTHIFIPLEQQELLTYSNQAIFNFDVSVQADKHLKIKGGVRKITDQDLGIKAGINYMPLDKLVFHVGILTHPAHYTFGLGLDIFNNIQLLASGMYQPDLGWSSGINIIYAAKK